MANLVRRDNRNVWRATVPDYRSDPFRLIDTLLRWDPPRSELGLLSYGGADYAPRFDVKETKDGYVIKADLPGVKDNDLAISLTGNQLTISGQRDTEQSEDGERYYAVERSHGSFARTFSLPDSIDSEHITAALKDGVLVVHIPKRPETQPKKIAIGAGESKTKS